MKDTWKYLFQPHILERGEEYYYDGRIDDVEKTVNGYSAIVHGTKDYRVFVVTDGEQVIDMDCTCPYAEGHMHCKHEAALLFRLTDRKQRAKKRQRKETLDMILRRLSKEQLIAELKEAAEREPEISRYLQQKYGRQMINESDPDDVLAVLSSLAHEYGDWDGYVDWRSGDEYAHAFIRCLQDLIEPMLYDGRNMEVFRALDNAFYVLNTVEMDGSSGEHSMIAREIERYWKLVVQFASREERTEMYDWFETMEAQSLYLVCSDSITNILDHSFDDPEFIEKRLEKVTKELEDPDIGEYRLKELLEKYKDLLQRCGKDPDEYNTWLENHSDSRAVKKIHLEEAKQQKDLTKETEIIEDLLSDKDHTEYSLENRLVELYRITGNTEKEKELLKKRVMGEQYGNSDQLPRLCKLCSSDVWDRIRENYLAKNPGMKVKIYYEEKLYDKLIEALKQQPIDVAERFREELKDRYPKQYLNMYVNELRRLEKDHPSPNLKEKMGKALIATATIKGGRKAISAIMDEWIEKYPTRKAMQRMIEEITNKLEIW